MDAANTTGLGPGTGLMGSGSINPGDILPLSLLPVSLAKDTLIAQYITVGTLAVFCLDIITHLEDDIKLLTKFRISLTTVVYFIARLTSFAEVLGTAIFSTTPVGSCSQLQHFNSISLVVAVTCNSYLFFLRIRAIFANSLPVKILFLLLWIMISAGGAAPLIGLTVANIGPTNYCTNTGIPKFVSVAMWTAVIFDGAVFTAISARLLANSYGNGGWLQDSENGQSGNGSRRSRGSKAARGWVNGFFYGTGLPKFSKALLKDGQFYYLIVTVINVTVLVLIYVQAPIWTVSFSQIDLFLTNCLTSHVFRKTRFGIYSHDLSSDRTPESGRHSIMTSHFHPGHTMSLHFQSRSSVLATESRWTRGSRSVSLSVNPHVGGIPTSSIGNNELLRPSTTGAAAAAASVAMSIPSPRSALFMSRTSESKDDVREKEMESEDEDDSKDFKKGQHNET